MKKKVIKRAYGYAILSVQGGESMKATILLAEDEQAMREVITDYFTAKSGGAFSVIAAPDGDTALRLIETRQFDLLLLDIMLPGTDGFALCRAAREQGEAPILFITAREDEQDKLHGYGLGADDYVVKPFSPKELMMCVNAVIKRSGKANSEPEKDIFTYKGLSVDFSARIVTIDGERVEMTPKEYELFFYMVKNKGIALTREKLINEVWGYDFFGDERTLDTHIKLLRKSLKDYSKCIVTLRGVGYRFETL